MMPNRNRGHAFYALGRLKPGEMNQGEERYAKFLDDEKHAGRVLWWKFQGIKLRLADNTFYTPDFNVMPASGVLEMHEVKGFWLDDARAKIKVAADIYPFVFVALKAIAKKHGGGWEVEDFSRSDQAAASERQMSLSNVEERRRPAPVTEGADPF
jgi:hypothetical protein